MPRVVQVPSSESSDSLEGSGIPCYPVYRTDSSDSESDRNRNYNQRMPSGKTDSFTSYLNYAVNYSLYNVTYNDAEENGYCLTCIIDGKEKKFKKDARVWLHKSSDRKRKSEDDTTESDASANKTSKSGETQVLETLREQIRMFDSEKYAKSHKRAVEVDLKSELSSLADSEADLIYSAESSSDAEQNENNVTDTDITITGSSKATAGPKTVRFDHKLETTSDYRVHTISSSSDEDCGHTVGSRSTVSYRSLLSEDDSNQGSRFGGNVEYYNESKNNFRSGILGIDMSRIAPAICIETESLNESILDYAVNVQNRSRDVNSSSGSRHLKSPMCKDAGYRILQASHNAMMKMKNKNKTGRVEKTIPSRAYNLRSKKKRTNKPRDPNKRKGKSRKTSTELASKMSANVEDTSQPKDAGCRVEEHATQPNAIRSESVLEFIDNLRDSSCGNIEITETNQNHNSIPVIPSLFVLASIKWYSVLKYKLDIAQLKMQI